VISQFEMERRFTYDQDCSLCSKRFKTLCAIEKHVDKKHPGENILVQNIRSWDRGHREAAVPTIKSLDKRSSDYKQGYLPWLAGLTEQINASLHPRLQG